MWGPVGHVTKGAGYRHSGPVEARAIGTSPTDDVWRYQPAKPATLLAGLPVVHMRHIYHSTFAEDK